MRFLLPVGSKAVTNWTKCKRQLPEGPGAKAGSLGRERKS